MKKLLIELWEGLLSLFFPNLCLACSENTVSDHELICVECKLDMPKTDFHLEKENPFIARFFGRMLVESGAALFFFSKRRHTQRLLHQLKYKNKPHLAVRVGRNYGRELKNSPHFQSVEAIVPVPMHPKKEARRGYNQATKFAEGLSETLEIPVLPDALCRREDRESQTKKSKMERLDNANELYAVAKPQLLEGKHILLVDDVLTSGATLESCGRLILAVPNTRLSLATIAIAMRGHD